MVRTMFLFGCCCHLSLRSHAETSGVPMTCFWDGRSDVVLIVSDYNGALGAFALP